MTTSWSAVNAISLMRWLETNTVLPSVARLLSKFLTQNSLGIEPVHRLVKEQDRRVAEECSCDA